MLYSFNGQYPGPLPNRIRLSDGSTRTDAENFTAEMIEDAGYYEVEDPPQITSTQKYIWDPTQARSYFIVVDLTQEELDQLKEQHLEEVGIEKNELLVVYYKIKLDEIEKNGEDLSYDMDELNTYLTAIEFIEDTYDYETGQVQWPMRPTELDELVNVSG